jgi:hypothetical protein
MHRRIGDGKTNEDPKEQVAEARRAFVVKSPKKNLTQAALACDEPSLGLIKPGLMKPREHPNKHSIACESNLFGEPKLTVSARHETHLRNRMMPIEAGLRCAETSVRASNSLR